MWRVVKRRQALNQMLLAYNILCSSFVLLFHSAFPGLEFHLQLSRHGVFEHLNGLHLIKIATWSPDVIPRGVLLSAL